MFDLISQKVEAYIGGESNDAATSPTGWDCTEGDPGTPGDDKCCPAPEYLNFIDGKVGFLTKFGACFRCSVCTNCAEYFSILYQRPYFFFWGGVWHDIFDCLRAQLTF